MSNPITLLDGAFGTLLWSRADQKGIPRKSVWAYNIEHPELVASVIHEYADAGSQIINSNTFSVNALSAKRETSYSAAQIVTVAVELSKRTLEGTGIKTALDLGPLPVLLEPYGDMEEDECACIYKELISAGVAAGADLIFLETFLDLHMMEVAARLAVSYNLPVFCSMTFEKNGRTILGNSVEQIARTLEPLGISAVGMNCSLGPELAVPIIREFSESSFLPLIFKPNAGLPVSSGCADAPPVDADAFAEAIRPILPLVTYLGACCGSAPGFIAKLKEVIES